MDKDGGGDDMEGARERSLQDFASYLAGIGQAQSTISGCLYRIRRLLVFARGREIDLELLEAFREVTAPTVEPNTWRTYVFNINSYNERNHIGCRLVPPRTIKKEADSLRQEEFERMLRAASDQRDSFLASRDRAVLLLMGEGAARAGEVRKIVCEDVDLEKGVMIVRRPKGKHDRKVYFGSATKDAVREYLPHRERAAARPDEPFLFLNSWGGPMQGANTVLAIVYRTAARAGLERRPHPHMFRHMRITQLSHDLNPFQLQRFAGHADISTTMTYVHVDEEEIMEAIRSKEGPSLAEPTGDIAEARRGLAIQLSQGRIDAETYRTALEALTDRQGAGHKGGDKYI